MYIVISNVGQQKWILYCEMFCTGQAGPLFFFFSLCAIFWEHWRTFPDGKLLQKSTAHFGSPFPVAAKMTTQEQRAIDGVQILLWPRGSTWHNQEHW